MSNSGFVTSRKKIDLDVVEQLLKQLCANDFKNFLCVERNENCLAVVMNEDENPFTQYMGGIEVYQETTRRLSFSPHSVGDFFYYIYIRVQEKIALHYDGTISDEGVDEKWKASGRYPTLASWINRRLNDFERQSEHMNANQKEKFKQDMEYFTSLEWKLIPKELHGI